MTSGDGHIGHTPTIELSNAPGPSETLLEVIAFFAFLLKEDPEDPTTFFNDEDLPPEGQIRKTEKGLPYISFCDDLVTGFSHPDDHSAFVLEVETSETRYVLEIEEVRQMPMLLVTVNTPCERCEEDRHIQDVAAFTRTDSAGYYLRSWLV